MKHKYILTVFLAMALLPAQSCKEWLEATSSTQVSDEKMFSSRSGFHEALTGVYIAMGSSSCYGRAYTFFGNELAALGTEFYNTVENASFKVFQQHNYTSSNASSMFESMWQGGYNVIANANKILSELETHRDVITDDVEYNLIRGEALAIRAYMHFDLMRMFGLSSWTGDNAGKRTVPYVTEYTLQVTPQRTYAETQELLLADVGEALECLKTDPVTGVKSADFDAVINTDGYWNNRTSHLNYYAVEALAARICLYAEDYDSARKYAQDVLDNVFDKGVVEWIDAEAEVNKSSNDQRDWTFACEQLFCLEITSLSDYTADYCFGNSPKMILNQNMIENMFPRAVEEGSDYYDGAEDIRGYALLLKYGGTGYTSYKFYHSSSLASAYRNRMPMIRVSELYYILALISYQEKDESSAIGYVHEVMSHRGCSSPKYAYADTKAYIGAEIEREYLGEGQMFYWGKVLTHFEALYSQPYYYVASESLLMYPYPTTETSYGHIQEK